MVSLAQVAAALDRPVDQLFELDRRPLRLAFVDGNFVTVVVRDRVSGATIEATLDATTGDQVDEAELRRRNHAMAISLGKPLSATLRDLLVRHPDLQAVQVSVTLAGGSASTRLLGAREIANLAQEPGITRIELVDEPQIKD